MAKAATEKSTKSATKTVNAKGTNEVKEKRAPTAYNNYVSTHMKIWKAENPGKTQTDAMRAVGVMWKEAPENPNRGKEVKARKPKENKDKAAAPAKKTKKSAAQEAASSSDVEDQLPSSSSG